LPRPDRRCFSHHFLQRRRRSADDGQRCRLQPGDEQLRRHRPNLRPGAFTYNGIVNGADYYAVLNDFDATLTAPPTTPGQLSLSNDTANPQTALDINWSAPTPPTGLTIDHYELQRSDFTSDGETFTTIASGLTTTHYTDTNGTTGLTAGNRYWYRVRAVYSDGSASAYSPKQVLNTILAPPTATVSADGKSIALVSEDADQLNASTLIYTWAALSPLPTGAPAPTYSGNGTATALSTTATIGAIGNYDFQVTITAPGDVVVSVADVSVTVAQVATSLTISFNGNNHRGGRPAIRRWCCRSVSQCDRQSKRHLERQRSSRRHRQWRDQLLRLLRRPKRQ
jgi:hypothetical protein